MKKETTHIVCFPISNQQILDCIRKLQDTIYTNAFYQKHDLKKAMVDLYSLNLTVARLRLRTPEEVEKVKGILDLYHNSFEALMKEALFLTFQGLGVFKKTQLYMQVFNDDCLRTIKDLSTSIRQALASAGVNLLPQANFVGQLTIFHYNDEQIAKGLEIDDDLWTPLMYNSFGHQQIRRLQLCDVREKPRWGYFKIEWEKPLEHAKC